MIDPIGPTVAATAQTAPKLNAAKNIILANMVFLRFKSLSALAEYYACFASVNV